MAVAAFTPTLLPALRTAAAPSVARLLFLTAAASSASCSSQRQRPARADESCWSGQQRRSSLAPPSQPPPPPTSRLLPSRRATVGGSGSTHPHRAPASVFSDVRCMTRSEIALQGRNVLGGEMQCCCTEPRTGFYRNGYCATGPEDLGVHTVCAVVTDDFLQFTRTRGNDLSTPSRAMGFPGLKAGDRWCLCASRWKEAFDAGVAPPVVLEACHEDTLRVVSLATLRAYAA